MTPMGGPPDARPKKKRFRIRDAVRLMPRPAKLRMIRRGQVKWKLGLIDSKYGGIEEDRKEG